MNLGNEVSNYFNPFAHINFGLIWTIVAMVLALGGGITLYFTFLRSKKKPAGFMGKVKDFLCFKKFGLEEILKFTYPIFAIFITLYSFVFITTDVAQFFKLLLGGNVALRLVYELLTMISNIEKNTKK